jgi:hypothetical protein
MVTSVSPLRARSAQSTLRSQNKAKVREINSKMKNSKNLPEIRDLEVLNRPKVGQKKSNFQEKLNL